MFAKYNYKDIQRRTQLSDADIQNINLPSSSLNDNLEKP